MNTIYVYKTKHNHPQLYIVEDEKGKINSHVSEAPFFEAMIDISKRIGAPQGEIKSGTAVLFKMERIAQISNIEYFMALMEEAKIVAEKLVESEFGFDLVKSKALGLFEQETGGK